MKNEGIDKIKKLLQGADSFENDRGNTVKTCNLFMLDRYFFDFKVCTEENGFEQFDTDQDASYFGVWVNREERCTVTYAEGDLSLVACASEESFKAEIADLERFYGKAPPMAVAIGRDGSVTKYYDERISAETM